MREAFICTCVIALLALTGCSASYQPTVYRSVQFSKTQPSVLKAMTFNIRTKTMIDGFNGWTYRKNMVVDTIKDHAADVVGLQEVRYSQLSHLQQALPQYNRYGVGRSNGRQSGESCPIFFRKDRYAMTESGTFWFSRTPDQPGSKSWGAMFPRICTWVHLVDKTTGTGLYVYNVHMDNLSQNSRKNSVRILAERIDTRKKKDPFIVMGDFNMEANNPAMVYLRNVTNQTPYPRMRDAWASVHFREPETGTRHGFRGSFSGPKIDHVSLCESLIPLDVEIDRRSYDGRYPSDHFPVVAKILLGKSGRLGAANQPDTPTMVPLAAEIQITTKPKPGV